jgi:hypothetical protein
MSEDRVACPRAGDDWLYDVCLVHLNQTAIWCPECHALWVDRVPAARNFEDYSTYMQQHGRSQPGDPSEIEIIGFYRPSREQP